MMDAYTDSQQNLIQEHSAGHIDCPACGRASSVIYAPLSPNLLYPEAFELWISHHLIAAGYEGNASFLSPGTVRDYRNCHSALLRFFANLRLDKIHPGHLQEYQRQRATNPQLTDALWWAVARNRSHGPFETRETAAFWSQKHGGGYELRQTIWAGPAGANRIRKEIAMLLQILRAARCWGEADDLCFRPLRPVEPDVRRAMDEAEEQRFLAMASSRPEWHFIYYYALLALRTTCSTNELRALRLGDISLDHGFLQISRAGSKCKGRMRTIPLETEDVIHALQWLMSRAGSMGATAPYHYLFPVAASKGKYDPAQPMTESGLKKRWEAVRDAANLDWLRPYDLRHTAITRMAEAGTPIQVIMSFAGHLTLRMQQHYTTISMMARRKTARMVWGTRPPPKFGAASERNQVINRFLYRA
jgi:integrase